MENVRIFYGYFEYFTAIWYNLLSFGIFCGRMVILPRFAMLYQEKSGNPGYDCTICFGVGVIFSAKILAPLSQNAVSY
jgi:hypothetical protein